MSMNNWLEKNRILILSSIGLFIIAGIAIFFTRWEPAAEIIILPPQPTATSEPMQVYVSGSVQTPDVYTLPPGAIVLDAVNAAGGLSDDAEVERLNMARILVDGEHVYIPAAGEQPAPVAAEGGSPDEVVISGPININIATQVELETLTGIGPATALKIIEYREANGPFATIEDIQNVPGIGTKTFEDIKEFITVG